MIGVVLSSIFQSIVNFFVRWYGIQSQFFWSKVFEFFSQLDRTFGIVVNGRLLFHPLYGDYSPVGRIIGPIFRLGRIVLGAMTYAVLFALAFTAWLVWLAIPALFILAIMVPSRI